MFTSCCGAADARGVTKAASRIAIYSTPEPSPKVINPPGGSSALVVALVAVGAAVAMAAAA
jgi:hypothetical protein